MSSSEHIEQVTFVNWFRKTYPNYIIFAIPNGELRNVTVAKRLKAEGVISGVPDLCCLLPDGITIWIEMKRETGGKVTKAQKEFHKKMQALGHTVKVCKGYKEAIEFFSK